MDAINDNNLRISEIFTAKAGKDWSRYFHGTIAREKDENGQECLVRSKIIIKTPNHDGYIIAIGENQWKLGAKLDELVLLVLDFELHKKPDIKIWIAETEFNLN